MKTQFTIEGDELLNDISKICEEIYPNCSVFYNGKKDNLHYFSVDVEINDMNEFRTRIEECKEHCKQKRLEMMNTVVCQVVKINGEYFIKDGDLKVPLYE